MAADAGRAFALVDDALGTTVTYSVLWRTAFWCRHRGRSKRSAGSNAIRSSSTGCSSSPTSGETAGGATWIFAGAAVAGSAAARALAQVVPGHRTA
jgi:hypothetical protein